MQVTRDSALLGIPQSEQSVAKLAKFIFGFLPIADLASKIGSALTDAELQFFASATQNLFGGFAVMNVSERADPLYGLASVATNRNSAGKVPPPTAIAGP
jgi:hypothetical protein